MTLIGDTKSWGDCCEAVVAARSLFKWRNMPKERTSHDYVCSKSCASSRCQGCVGYPSREVTLVSLYWNGLSDVHILEIDK